MKIELLKLLELEKKIKEETKEETEKSIKFI